MLSREDLSNRLNHLVPDAKFSFWPVGNRNFKRVERQLKSRTVIEPIFDASGTLIDEVERQQQYYEDVEVSGLTDMGNEDPLIVIDGWEIDWRRLNNRPCPTEQELKALDLVVVEEALEAKRISAMASEMSKNFAVQCAYHAYALGEINPINIEDFVFDVLRANKLS